MSHLLSRLKINDLPGSRHVSPVSFILHVSMSPIIQHTVLRIHNTSITSPGDRHVSEIASMALDLLAGSVVFQIPHRPNARLNIRMGIHRSDSLLLVLLLI